MHSFLQSPTQKCAIVKPNRSKPNPKKTKLNSPSGNARKSAMSNKSTTQKTGRVGRSVRAGSITKASGEKVAYKSQKKVGLQKNERTASAASARVTKREVVSKAGISKKLKKPPAQVVRSARKASTKSAAKVVSASVVNSQKPKNKPTHSVVNDKKRAASLTAEAPKNPRNNKKPLRTGLTGQQKQPVQCKPLVQSKSRGRQKSATELSQAIKGRLDSRSKAATTVPEIKKSLSNPKVLKKIRMIQSQRDASKDIGFRPRAIKAPGEGDPFWEKEPQQDRIGLFVRDPFWLHATWDVTRLTIERAQSALAEQWHDAKPILRLMRLDDMGSSTSAESLQADIEIRGGVRNWYIPWTGESAVFRISIGYLGKHGRFHLIASSNTVKTPEATSPDAIDDHWSHLAPEGERIFALSGGYVSERDSGELRSILESRLQRNLGAPELARLAVAAEQPHYYRSDFFFEMDVELVFYGAAHPNCYVTISEEPVTLRPDGSFALRVPFPERRNVIPAVAVTRDGSHQKTIVVGVERNTKVMEPYDRDNDSSD